MIDVRFMDQLLEKIITYKNICIFFHEVPDFDALGSGFALYQWLTDNFDNEKNIYIMIEPDKLTVQETKVFQNFNYYTSAENIDNVLGIVVDTANKSRILNLNQIECKELISIDHHPKVENFAQLEFIDPSYPAVAQILAMIFQYYEQKGLLFTSKVATYLYAGILTDTNNFLSTSVLPSTYQVLSYLVSLGINRSLIHDAIFNQNLVQKKFQGHVINKIRTTKNGLAYAIISKRSSKKYEMENIPTAVHYLSNINDVEIWTTLNYDFQFKKFKASIRSKNIQINNIAKEFGGGGHKNMAATVFEKKQTYIKLLQRLDEYLVEMGYADTIKSKHNFWLSKHQKLNKFKLNKKYKKNNE